MSQRSAVPSTFVIERTFPVPLARVFHAFADAEAKRQWGACADVLEHAMDFRVGGRELIRVGSPGGVVHRNDTVYHDIVPDERIVWSYALALDERLISVSLATLELAAEGDGTRLTLTEQGVYLDGYDGAAEREHGTGLGMDALAAVFEREGASV